MESIKNKEKTNTCLNGVCDYNNEGTDDVCVTDCDLEDIHPDDLDE